MKLFLMTLPNTEMKVVMFIDIINYTSTTLNLSYEKMNLLHDNFDSIVNNVIFRNSGTIIKKIGDGFLCTFPNSFIGVTAAIALQADFKNYNCDVDKDIRITVRISLNKGFVLLREEDVFGTTVNIASRINQFGKSGTIIISEGINKELDNGIFSTTYIGKKNLKGVSFPIRLFAINSKTLTFNESSSSAFEQKILVGILLILAILVIAFAFTL